MGIALAIVALAAGAAVELLRVSGRPPLGTIFAEDLSVFLPQALSGPGHLFAAYAGYLELLPRLIGELAAVMPLPDAARVFAICGAMTASAVALFVFYASAGHVNSAGLRMLLALAVLLLPVAPFEIIDSGVNAPWYLLFALFWAALWRPRARAGLAAAALTGLLAAASTPLALAIAPLLAARLAALRRIREHAVTAGWAVGLLLQLPVIHAAHRSRLDKMARPGPVLAFYAHDVLLPALGWRLSWLLRGALGANTATAVMAAVLAAVFCLILVTQPSRVRLFTCAALITGFLVTATGATLSGWVTALRVTRYAEPASRYTTLAIFLICAALIVAADSVARRADLPSQHRTSLRGNGTAAVTVTTVLVAVLAVGWLSDFHSAIGRGSTTVWAPIANRWLTACERSATAAITIPSLDTPGIVVSCANLRR